MFKILQAIAKSYPGEMTQEEFLMAEVREMGKFAGMLLLFTLITGLSGYLLKVSQNLPTFVAAMVADLAVTILFFRQTFILLVLSWLVAAAGLGWFIDDEKEGDGSCD